MLAIRVEDAVGTVLCHDLTKIVPGKIKEATFKKGQVITEKDISELLKMGKSHVYVWEVKKDQVHEDDAAIRLSRALGGHGISFTEPKEGKVSLIADFDGMCTINEDLLFQVNMLEDMVVATRSNRRPVKKGDMIAGIRVVPLVIHENKLQTVEHLSGGQATISVKPFHSLKVGIITTGSEVYHGRIKDEFGPVVKIKIESYGCKVFKQIIVPDDVEQISAAIHSLKAEGAELILTTGGMSVDPDDVTPRSVREAGAEIITYGAPVLPGAMLMVAYLGDVTILGLPGCVMYHKTTIFDLMIPSVLTGERITKAMVAKLGLGGLCLNCKVCSYPICTFGTGA
ncbi:molybdopterin-binding protein [Desulfosporosinus fructosivorans]|uniref:Molybdopterin molybdenumtransferase n=1 Tax=Desulfosporosinus fructosivorans TaxID=2018669 RepID=A0A4Z0R881_9FIRM|nr:molybdopterin-binding protein [Desulfosporosinus fructosivorans]TGE38353.1 molybdopterin-binding protein [Desulfosporosinus fructosivorans]